MSVPSVVVVGEPETGVSGIVGASASSAVGVGAIVGASLVTFVGASIGASGGTDVPPRERLVDLPVGDVGARWTEELLLLARACLSAKAFQSRDLERTVPLGIASVSGTGEPGTGGSEGAPPASCCCGLAITAGFA